MAARKKSAAKKKAASKRKSPQPRAKKSAKKRAAAKRLKATAPAVGTLIERTFKGKVYKLRVTDDGYALGNQTFKSLTAAAKHVTKYPSVSGVRFWLGAAEKGGSK